MFEGGDGVGKSTQIDALLDWLRAGGAGPAEVVATREPGGTPLGIELRQAVMHGDHVAPRAEALLYAADRAHHIATIVRPALERGAIVVQDRYLDSSIVYQGGARGLGDMVGQISLWATEGAVPDLTVVLDMAPRPDRMARDLDRVERETAEHAERIREGFPCAGGSGAGTLCGDRCCASRRRCRRGRPRGRRGGHDQGGRVVTVEGAA